MTRNRKRPARSGSQAEPRRQGAGQGSVCPETLGCGHTWCYVPSQTWDPFVDPFIQVGLQVFTSL